MANEPITIGLFNKDAAIITAERKGFLAAESIAVTIHTVTDSPTLLRNLINGTYDLILNNADNVIAWAEGQGEDPQKNDFVIFLGGSQGVDQKLVVAPGIGDFKDLRGKLLAVDAVTTGYAVVAVYILKQHGLEWNKDFTFKSFGNTIARADAMSRGDAFGAMMSMTDDEIHKRNFKILARAEDYVKHYARGLGATRRPWANQNDELLVRFVRAMVRATDWLQNDSNRAEAINLFLAETKNNQKRAEAIYRQALSPTMGLTPRSRIDLDGIRTIIEMREAAGLMTPPVPQPEKYIDERFYQRAIESLK